MRKVYHHTHTSRAGLALTVVASVAVTAIVFGIIPFSHVIAKPGRQVELRKASAVDLPPPAPEEPPPPPPDAEPPPEAPPEPQLAERPQPIPLTADLDVALGFGGALAGFGEIRALAAPESAVDTTFDMAELEKRPEPVSQVPPAYPPELRKSKIEGFVTLVFALDEEGRVEDPRVESSSRPEFEKAALEAIRKWRFRPGMREGQAVRSFVRIPMRFRVTSG
jgi:protein TonB